MNTMTNLSYKPCPPAGLSSTRPSTWQAGLSLVELMIALAIGLLLLLGISTLIVQQNNTRSEMDKASRQIENGRYAMQLLHDDIQLAGFYGGYSPANNVATAIPDDPCDATANLGWDAATPQVPVAIHGYAGGAGDPTPGKCLDNYLNNTAVLVIRRVSSATTPPSLAAANTTYLQVSNCSTDAAPFVLGTANFTLRQRGCATTTNPSICTPINPADNSANTWMGLSCLRLYVVRIYYISSCTVCGSDSVPTLKVREMVGGNASTIPLVEGIQNMQFDYGIDGDSDADGNMDDINGDGPVDAMDLDGAPDSYTATPAAATWPHVMAVRVNLLARNNEPSAGYKDTKKYSLGGAGTVGPFNDTYKRHAYSQLVRATNPSGRRE